MGDRLADWAYGAGWGLVRRVPDGLARTAFDAAADLAAWRGGPGTTRLRRNLTRVVPQADDRELDELVRRALRSYARYWREAFRLPTMDPDAIHRAIDAEVTGKENLAAALADGNGAILALPHSGNWDAAGVWLVREHGGLVTVNERLKPESLYRRFAAYRESLGFELLPATGGPIPPAATLSRRLRRNKIVCLLADRDLTPTGIPVTFFGERTRFPPGPAFLAARTGAALIPAGLWFTDTGWGLRLHPRIKVQNTTAVPAATQTLADTLAADIARHPADWHMMQPLWPADLPTPTSP